MKKKRAYRSRVRDRQVEDTRDRILQAVVGTMGNGLEELSIPAVARAAGVSVPTIYRHFGTKRGLLEGMVEYIGRQSGLDVPLGELDDLEGWLDQVFRAHARMEVPLRAAMASGVGRELRRSMLVPERRRGMGKMLESATKKLSDAQRERLVDVSICVCGSKFFEACRDYHGQSPDEAARTAAWVMKALAEAARRGLLPPVEG